MGQFNLRLWLKGYVCLVTRGTLWYISTEKVSDERYMNMNSLNVVTLVCVIEIVAPRMCVNAGKTGMNEQSVIKHLYPTRTMGIYAVVTSVALIRSRAA